MGLNLSKLEETKEELINLIDHEQMVKEQGKPTVTEEMCSLWYEEMNDVCLLIKSLLNSPKVHCQNDKKKS